MKGGKSKTTSAKVKVRKWNRGLRRRKGKPEDEEPGVQVTVDGESVGPSVHEIVRVLRRSSGSNESIRTTESAQRSEDPTAASDSASRRTEQPPEDPEISPPTDAQYFPPAYRPASVRSCRLSIPVKTAPSATAGLVNETELSLESPVPVTAEKTGAPGYFPAPVSEEAENAIALASRSDGKANTTMFAVDETAQGRTKTPHLATDDKHVLEQLRLGASAPPVSPSSEGGDGNGPSAPHVDVDEQGFERTMDDLEYTPTPRLSSGPELDTRLPLPPQMIAQRFFRSPESKMSSTIESFDELHLLPSAPLVAASSEVPSAPSMSEDEDYGCASAPPLLPELDREDEGIYDQLSTSDDGVDEVDAIVGNSLGPSVVLEETTPGLPSIGVLTFLPKYEP